MAGSIPVDWYNNVVPVVMIALGLSQGWAMAIPDYEGPNSVYGGAILGGQATLDGIRAAEGFAPMELTQGAGTPVVMAGFPEAPFRRAGPPSIGKRTPPN
ncbi:MULTISPECIES: lipase family protein [unclassified Nocardia]|uniref:lipase family protein n=1 Tax=unclassified Nocardia TaxID=2637762 RepID=UPI0027E07B16|nr:MULTISPECIES: lipase family protein [unclassified Nocardia]